jgi:GAF domain-containing protein
MRRLPAAVRPTRRSEATLTALLVELVALYDVDGGAIYLAEDGGLSLHRAAALEDGAEGDEGRAPPPERLALGESAPGRAALERRPQMIHAEGGTDAGGRATIAAPMASAGSLVGVICLTTRPSRLTGRGEMLLLQALANRVGEVLLGPEAEQTARLKEALDRFRASWSAADHT